MRRFLLPLYAFKIGVFLLSACSLPEQSQDSEKVFAKALGPNLYAVSFTGNSIESRVDARNLAKNRSLKICKVVGYKGFRILDTQEYSSYSKTPINTSCNNVGQFINCTSTGGNTIKHSVNQIIVSCKEPLPSLNPSLLNWHIQPTPSMNSCKSIPHHGSMTVGHWQDILEKEGYQNCSITTPKEGKYHRQMMHISCKNPTPMRSTLFRKAAYCRAFINDTRDCNDPHSHSCIGKLFNNDEKR